ncbi:early endosome antigen 1-like isoform X2 [Ptychodera flava]|uniref:early endosome antigen 1-like isoform X2 n=1 Tax=Ptychodera flava TaxID=63121 RepID=UPI003969C631
MVVDLNQSKSMMMSLKERMLKRYKLMMKTLIRYLTQQSQKELLIELQLNTDSHWKTSKLNLRWKGQLESQLKEVKEEKATLEERCKELTQKFESTKQSMVSQHMDNSAKQKELQSELEEKKKLINELEDKMGELKDKVSELEYKLEQSEQRKSGEKGDGGKLDPVEVFDDVIEGKDVEEIHVDDEETDQKSKKMMTGRVDSSSEGQSLEDIQSTPEMERTTLESQLKETKEEKATLEERRKELTQKLERTEQSLVSQRIALFSQRIGKSTEREKLQSELEEKEKLTKKLDNTVEEFKHNLEHSSQKKQAEKAQTSMPQRPPQHHHEMSTGHMMQASAATDPLTTPVVYSQAQQMPYQTDQSHTQGTITSQMIPQKVENQSNIQSTQKPQMYISTPQGHLTPPYHQGQNLIPQEIRSSNTQVYALEDIQSTPEMERATLESQLKETKKEKATLEERRKELTQKLERTEQSLVSQRIALFSQRIGKSAEREKLQSELEEKEKLTKKLDNTVEEFKHNLEHSSQKKQAEKAPTLRPQRPSQHQDEMSTGHMMQASAATGPPTSPVVYSQAQQMPYPTAQPHAQGTITSQMIPQKVQNRSNIQSSQKPKKYRSSPQGHLTSPHHQGKNPIPQEIETSATQLSGPPTTPVVYSQSQQMPYPTDQSHTQGTITGQMRPQRTQLQDQPNIQSTQKPKKYRSSPQGHLTSPHRQGKNPIPQEIQTKATPVSGDWSVTLVNGQHQGQGQKFKLPRGLAFHRDKLVVCDSGNNIVQILNKDYTCDKVIGSFDGQFAKPFRPKRVAISRFNHYFILDDENKQIVVCDENGKIIQIITLPENIKVVFDIALMDDFVLVTLSLTSLDITRRKDRDDRLVKYTQSGEYVKDVGGQTSVQTKFFWPESVAVNSKNVIMVYDWGNECIKCFDSDLNFLHQFGQSQLQRPRTESVIDGGGYIAVDEDDNVYVCGSVRVKSTGDVIKEWIVKYGCDGKFICDLFKGFVSLPVFIAVMGDKIGVVEYLSDQIKVFSK